MGLIEFEKVCRSNGRGAVCAEETYGNAVLGAGETVVVALAGSLGEDVLDIIDNPGNISLELLILDWTGLCTLGNLHILDFPAAGLCRGADILECKLNLLACVRADVDASGVAE